MHDRIKEAIPVNVLLEASNKLNELKTLLAPYLYSLTLAERHDMLKMSNKSYSFVSKVEEYCNTNPEFKTGYMEEMLNLEFTTTAALRPILEQSTQLNTLLDDTVMIAGSEAFAHALVYYGAVKTAAKNGRANAKPIFEDLSARFPGHRPKVKDGGSTDQ